MSLFGYLKQLFSGKQKGTLYDLACRYENEVLPQTYVYTLKNKGRKEEVVRLKFTKGNFCHLFSIASMVRNVTGDLKPFMGIEGWNNIKNQKITYSLLKRLDAQQYAYYHKEQTMFDEFLKTLRNPMAVVYDPKKNPGSRLEADYILYGIFKGQVVHIDISKDKNGDYFPRSYFVRDLDQDKAYPTRYIAGMESLKVRCRIS